MAHFEALLEASSETRQRHGTRNYDWDYFWWRPCVPTCPCMITHGPSAGFRQQRLLRTKRKTEGWLERERDLVCLRCPSDVMCLREFYSILNVHRPAITRLPICASAALALHLVVPRLCQLCAARLMTWLETTPMPEGWHSLIHIILTTWRPGTEALRHEIKVFLKLQTLAEAGGMRPAHSPLNTGGNQESSEPA